MDKPTTLSKVIYREETDSLGSMMVPADALYGIHSMRAVENFPDKTPFQFEWYKAMGVVKLACYNAYKSFKKEALQKYCEKDLPITFIKDEVIDTLIKNSAKVSDGEWFDQFVIPAIQGGAGTSINMNVNEIIANLSLKDLGRNLGDYSHVDPIEHANVYQSTNDVVPTALKVAVMRLLMRLENAINLNRELIENAEGSCRNVLRQGYTQMQGAIPTSYDKLFSSYNNALSRDWWRVSKCLERIKEVNLGGGALGTGLSIPRYFIVNVVGELQKLTGLPLTRSENLPDATSNLDSLVEVHATLKAHAVNLEKISSDIRLLGADLFVNREVLIPAKQVGSSIMPGKVNPVISEYIISSVHKVYANDMLISNLCGQGCLDLNAYLPVIGHSLVESVLLLINANEASVNGIFRDLSLPKKSGFDGPVYFNPSIVTALSPYIGYHKAGLLAKEMKQRNCSVFSANNALKVIAEERLNEIMLPQNLLKLGYSINDVLMK